jgi:hypothetical protein
VRTPQLATRSVRILTVPLLVAGLVAGVAPAASPAARAGPAGPAVSTPFFGQLNAVAATSADNAWAVGYINGETLIERWNGTAWKWVPTLTLGPPSSDFYGVAATSAGNALAAGFSPGGSTAATLIAHWNGTTWKQVPSPNSGYSVLQGVAAVSASNAWAVGVAGGRTLIVHWNGKAWTQVPSPNPGSIANDLYSVTATSATNAWAVGYAEVRGPKFTTLILHWNGKTWTRVPSPSPTVSPELYGVAATSASNAWAVGWSAVSTLSGSKTLILHWDGKTWTQVPSPNPAGSGNGHSNILQGVTATSAGNAWAVGSSAVPLKGSKNMILHWNGKAWTQVPSPNPFCATCDSLYGVTATSAKNAWAVGTVNSGGIVVILRWNGTTWKNSPSAPQPG